jgi:L-rhamnose isomerase/sugar isomerase
MVVETMLDQKKQIATKYDLLEIELAQKGIDIEKVKEKLSAFTIEVPSWVFGEFGGGRFSDFMPLGAARNIFEKFDDASMIHKLTGVTPNVSIQIGCDDPDKACFDEIQPDSFKRLSDYAQKVGIRIGTVNPTYFLEGSQLGSLSANNPVTRCRYVNHSLVSVDVAAKYGTGYLTMWLPDGSFYPGQVNLQKTQRNLRQSLIEIYKYMPESVKMLIEYKFFEPGTYHTVLSDVSVALNMAQSLGKRAGVIIDLGHHPHGVNVEHIVANLIEGNILGGLHLNTRYAADDDHAVEPNMQIFRIFHELKMGGVIGNSNSDNNWPCVIDQASALENRIQAVIHSVDSLIISYAKALIVDEEQLEKNQNTNEVLLANRTLTDAFLTDVRPIIYKTRLEKGLSIDPVEAYIKSGYQEKIEKERL